MPFHFFYTTHMINFLRNLATDLQSIIPDISEKDEISNMFNCHVYIVNFFFGLISVLTENTVSSSYEEKIEERYHKCI